VDSPRVLVACSLASVGFFGNNKSSSLKQRKQPYYKRHRIYHNQYLYTFESIEIQRDLHAINVLVILFILTTLKPICFTYLSQSGVSTKQLARQHLYWQGGQCIFGANHRKHYTVCVHECYYRLFTCQFLRSLCSFLSKSLSTVGQGYWMHTGSLPQNLFCSMSIVTALM
jgi:hypothetical protein